MSQPPEKIPLEQREAVVHSVVFHSGDDGFSVVSMQDVATGERYTAVGNFHSISPGMPLIIRGRQTVHPKYGPRFSIEEYETRQPTTEDGVRRYLESFIKGIGPTMAERIVKRFGADTITVIEKEPKRLTEVSGIGKKKAEEISRSWTDQIAIKDVMIFLQTHGVSPGYAIKIFKEYGQEATAILQKNPYVLAGAIRGIGFKIADRIAMKLGISPDAPERIRAGFTYVLDQATDDGHVFLPREVLAEKARATLEADPERIESELTDMLRGSFDVVDVGGRIYLAPFLYFERESAKKLAEIIAHNPPAARTKLDGEKIRAEFFRSTGLTLDDEQFTVLDALATDKVVILTGGPGTGKTVATRAVIQMFGAAGKNVLLAAPTGRAAKRLFEATGMPAKTIHRLLEYNQKAGFIRNATSPLDADLVVIDEASMIDLWLFHNLLQAIRTQTKILFVGDVDQLPSVGAGNVLRDMIKSEMIRAITLKNIHRQAAESAIVINAHRVNRGEMPIVNNVRKTDFFFIERDDPEKMLDSIVTLCTGKITAEFGYRPSQIQMITPMYRGPVGVDNINLKIQEKVNPGKDFKCGPRTFRVDDRVMQTQNNYDKDVFNGDVGYVTGIDRNEKTLSVDFSDRSVEYTFTEADQLVLAYAVTVHKSQGSEYPVIVFAITTHHFPMLQRNLLYTAITRAKNMAILVGAKRAVSIAVRNNTIEERHTALGERLKEYVMELDR